jgi:hypothetical protein
MVGRLGTTGDLQNLTQVQIRDLLGIPETVVLAANQTFNAVAPGAITGLTFSGVANTRYKVKVEGAFTSAATTTGMGIALDVPTGATVSGFTLHPTSATISGMATQTADGAVGATTGVAAIAPTAYHFTAEFEIVLTTAGPVNALCRSEVAASNIILLGNRTSMSYVRY